MSQAKDALFESLLRRNSLPPQDAAASSSDLAPLLVKALHEHAVQLDQAAPPLAADSGERLSLAELLQALRHPALEEAVGLLSQSITLSRIGSLGLSGPLKDPSLEPHQEWMALLLLQAAGRAEEPQRLELRKIASLAPLEGFPSLQRLGIFHSKRLQQLEPLAKLPALVTLSLEGMEQLEDFSVLSAIPGLTESLHVGPWPRDRPAPRWQSSSEQLHRVWQGTEEIVSQRLMMALLSCPDFFSDLEVVMLAESTVYELSPLRALKKLRVLNLSDASLPCGLQDLTELRTLQQLDLLRCQELESLPSLSALASLSWLRVSDTDLKDFERLRGLDQLKSLLAQECWELEDVSALASLPQLKALYLDGCEQLTELPLLPELPLETLFLSGCTGLRGLSPVASLGSLKTLSLASCPQLTDLSPLASLPLVSLSLEDCTGLSDFSPLRELSELQKLDLRGCEGLPSAHQVELQSQDAIQEILRAL